MILGLKRAITTLKLSTNILARLGPNIKYPIYLSYSYISLSLSIFRSFYNYFKEFSNN